MRRNLIIPSLAPFIIAQPKYKPKPKAKGDKKKIQHKNTLDRVKSLLGDMSASSSDSDEQRGSGYYFSLFSAKRSPKRVKNFVKKIQSLSQRHLDQEEKEDFQKALSSFEDRLCRHHREISLALKELKKKIQSHFESLDNLIIPSCNRRYPYVFLGSKLVSLRFLAKRQFSEYILEYQILKRRFGIHCLPLSGARFVTKELEKNIAIDKKSS